MKDIITETIKIFNVYADLKLFGEMVREIMRKGYYPIIIMRSTAWSKSYNCIPSEYVIGLDQKLVLLTREELQEYGYDWMDYQANINAELRRRGI